jgi:hypothetical protein
VYGKGARGSRVGGGAGSKSANMVDGVSVGLPIVSRAIMLGVGPTFDLDVERFRSLTAHYVG